MNEKNGMENMDLETRQPQEASAEPAAEPAAQAPQEPAPAPAPQAPQKPEPAPAWEPPTPQLTLDPDPEVPPIEFTTEPPHAPEPPVPPQAHGQQANEPQPTVQNQYVYNFNTPPASGQEQGQPYSQPYAGYQPPNYTSQSYRSRPQQQPVYTTPPVGYQQKSRLAAGLLGLIFGVFGVHNFYMGFNSRGTIQLLLALVGGVITCGVGTVAAAVWAFIEAVMILSSTGPRFDGNGVIMKD